VPDKKALKAGRVRSRSEWLHAQGRKGAVSAIARRQLMDQIYQGYSMNDPGIIIRSLPDRIIVGYAVNYGQARDWIDAQNKAAKR
jgi:hypothetical protein